MAISHVVIALLFASVAAFQPNPWQRNRIWNTRDRPTNSPKYRDCVTAVMGQTVRDDEKVAKTNKRGFPAGDPRSKGGLENDYGLQVGPLMWRWPSSWPYAEDFHDTKFNDTFSYFSENVMRGPFVAPASREKLEGHMIRNIPNNAAILDLGAGFETSVPAAINAESIVGIGANMEEMEANPLLQDRKVMDLNKVSKTNPLPFSDQSFDSVISTFAVEYLTKPRDVFAEIYRVLKPGGMCFVCFTAREAYKGYDDKQAKFWGEMNDAQKMYVVGSYFQFSCGGWSQLKGFDLAEEEEKEGLLSSLNLGGQQSNSMFVVSCTKALPPGPEAPPLARMQAKLWDTEHMNPDDRTLCCERLVGIYRPKESADEQDTVIQSALQLDSIYEILSPMSKVLPTPVMAMLAANLAPSWRNTPTQRDALREGLGLSKAQETFWKPLGAATSDLGAEDKIWLLVDLLPYFAEESQDEGLAQFPELLLQAQEAITATLPDIDTDDVQLLALDICITEFLLIPPSQKDSIAEFRAGFLPWLSEQSPQDLRLMLEARKAYKGEPETVESE